jgi:bacterioferritin
MPTQKTDRTQKTDNKQHIVQMLQKAYRMEVETVLNYLANSIYLDGMQAEEIKRALSADVTEELGHARRLGQRLKQIGGRIPGSLELKFDQESLRPPQSTTDVRSVIHGVIDAEHAAIEHYRDIIHQAESNDDPVTSDMAIQILGEEAEHLRLFEGFLAELESRE